MVFHAVSYVLFFFFKQKTAYEMRISDWSSDVCSSDLAAVVGEKKAREIWFLCRQYTAEQARDMGLVNAVVPHDKLMEEARAWAGEIVQLSPTAIKLAKQSFNMSSEKFRGVEAFASSALALYYDTDEAMEGRNAFIEKRRPDFGKFAK